MFFKPTQTTFFLNLSVPAGFESFPVCFLPLPFSFLSFVRLLNYQTVQHFRVLESRHFSFYKYISISRHPISLCPFFK